MATMKAARWHAAKDVRIEEVEVPEVQPHQVKVAVKFTGICGTDLHEYLGFVPGAYVTVISAHGGDIIVNVKDSRLAITREMAQKIQVQPAAKN